ncbi:putative cyclin family protein [Lyophyllum shimeji]|uniref:Cyclin family protein n=1 Tax=Lyophyllum shimeji TaxID=47721 RepID=A0A9P3PGD2_LYOSH|nr:putative cyclin family protein [Lyophyllum shimeji]
MCRWRQVQHIFALCNHVYNVPDEMIQCDDRWCKFSTTHPADCGPNCKNTCWQYRQFPQQRRERRAILDGATEEEGKGESLAHMAAACYNMRKMFLGRFSDASAGAGGSCGDRIVLCEHVRRISDKKICGRPGRGNLQTTSFGFRCNQRPKVAAALDLNILDWVVVPPFIALIWMVAIMPPSSQWIFQLSALHMTPSTGLPIDKQLYDRARGVEFLFRLGSSLGLPSSAMFTAATWFHRFYMRYSMEDFHRQDVAASCIFLATKTEECGRKLRDVARVCHAKITSLDISSIPADSKEVDELQAAILLTEEYLLEAICFDLVVESPHAELVDLFDTYENNPLIQEYAWSLAHDSYRTPMCILYPPKIIAAACYVLAQRIFDGPNSPSLDARISASAPTASLPTPPSHKPPSPDASRYAIEHFTFSETELSSVAEALSLLLEFYSAQDAQTNIPYLSAITAVPPPTAPKPNLYVPAVPAGNSAHVNDSSSSDVLVKGPAPERPETQDAVSVSSTPADGAASTGQVDVRLRVGCVFKIDLGSIRRN